MHTGLTETIAVVGVVIIGILSVFYADTNTVSIVTGGILGWLGKGLTNR